MGDRWVLVSSFPWSLSLRRHLDEASIAFIQILVVTLPLILRPKSGAAPCPFLVFRNQEDITRRNVAIAGNWSLEHILAMYKALAGLSPSSTRRTEEPNLSWDVLVHTCNLNIWKIEVKWSVRGHLWVYSEFEISIGHGKPKGHLTLQGNKTVSSSPSFFSDAGRRGYGWDHLKTSYEARLPTRYYCFLNTPHWATVVGTRERVSVGSKQSQHSESLTLERNQE